MASVTANGITIEHETFGDPADPTLLLVMGLGSQLVSWPRGLCERLAAEGFHVVIYDNRDTGLSSKIEGGPKPDVAAAMGGDVSSASYTLDHMADDGMALLDALGIDAAHVMGVSMGGMIAQTMAVRHPARVRSLCSIMSNTGAPEGFVATPEAIAVLFRPPATTRDEAIEASIEGSRVIGSTGFPLDEDWLRERAELAYDRCFYPVGIARQLLAIHASGDRTETLRAVDVPTVVIHGSVDPLVPPVGGELTAKAIPGASLVVIEGMGHDLPEGVWDRIVEEIAANAAKAAA